MSTHRTCDSCEKSITEDAFIVAGDDPDFEHYDLCLDCWTGAAKIMGLYE